MEGIPTQSTRAKHVGGALADAAVCTGALKVGRAGFSDVPPFLVDIAQGALQCKFNTVYLEFLGQVALARLLLGAVLRALLRGVTLDHPGWYLLRVRDGRRTLGCALVSRCSDQDGALIDIRLVAVRPDARRRGAGSTLVRHVLQCARGDTRVRCTCTVYAHEMVALVQKLDFRRTQVGRELASGVRRPDEFTYRSRAGLKRSGG